MSKFNYWDKERIFLYYSILRCRKGSYSSSSCLIVKYKEGSYLNSLVGLKNRQKGTASVIEPISYIDLSIGNFVVLLSCQYHSNSCICCYVVTNFRA